jgi:hypothetical protein
VAVPSQVITSDAYQSDVWMRTKEKSKNQQLIKDDQPTSFGGTLTPS